MGQRTMPHKVNGRTNLTRKSRVFLTPGEIKPTSNPKIKIIRQEMRIQPKDEAEKTQIEI